MAQEQSIEAARARIQRLVDEIAVLSKKEMRPEEFFQQFLVRAVQATDAKGGAVWLVGQRGAEGKAEFQLASQIEFESSLFHNDELQHAILLRSMSEAISTKTPQVSPPEPPAPAPGSIEAQLAQMQGTVATPGANRTVYPFFHIPIQLKDQVLGVLQMWLQPYVKQAAYQEFVTFLTSLATHIEQHLQTRRVGTLVVENQRLQHVLKFTGDIAGTLNPLEVARLSVNYGRDLVGCERCSLLTREGEEWKVLAISGQEVVEPKSSMVKAMTAFVGAHGQPDVFLRVENDPRTNTAITRHQSLILSKKELLARAESPVETVNVHGDGANAAQGDGANPVNGETNGAHPGGAFASFQRRTDEIDLAYFEHSHVVSAAIAPLYDEQKELIGAYFAESTAEGFFDSPPGTKDGNASQRLTEWLALHTGKALSAAHEYQSLPLLAIGRKVRDLQRSLTGNRRKRTLMRFSVIGVILLLASLYPKEDLADGNCIILPSKRATVVPEVGGRIEKVLVHEGETVKKNQPVAMLNTTRLETELQAVRQEGLRSQAEADRYRAAGDEAAAQISLLQEQIAAKSAEKLQMDIAATTLRSPIDGVVLTKDLLTHTGEYIQPGVPFVEIASLESWDLQVDVTERKIGAIEGALRNKPLEVEYILYSHSGTKLQEKLSTTEQISAVAVPREKEQAFVLTFTNIEPPKELKELLRPGLTGRAQVKLGHEITLWWFCKRVAEWTRLKLIG